MAGHCGTCTETRSPTRHEEIIISAAEWFETGAVNNIKLAADGAITLQDRVLLENDAPGAGIVLPNETGNEPTVVDQTNWIRKRFFIQSPLPKSSTLIILVNKAPRENPLTVEVNGHAKTLLPRAVEPKNTGFPYRYHSPSAGRFYGWGRSRRDRDSGWFYCDIPGPWLTPGWNTVVLKSKSSAAWQILRTDYFHYQKGSPAPVFNYPHTSAKMTDAPSGVWVPIDGEWCIRLMLKKYMLHGMLESPILDLGQLHPAKEINRRTRVSGVRLGLEADCLQGTEIEIQMRSGDSPFYRPVRWSNWQRIVETNKCSSARFVQWRFSLRSDDGMRSPRLTAINIAVESETTAGDWESAVKINEIDRPGNFSAPHVYLYEDYTLPELKRLRRDWELDRYVEKAETEFGLILALMNWAYRIPLKNFEAEDWPLPDFSWNALDYLILDRDADGNIRYNTYDTRRRDLYCMTSNFVLMQALLSFGIQARYMTINGHEVCEVWSNDHRKWVYLDATRDYYFAHRDSGKPLNILETKRLLEGDPDALILVGSPTNTLNEKDAEGIKNHAKEWMTGFRMIPRNNYISQRYPVPLNPGYRLHWPWNGYLEWESGEVPVLHAPYTSSRAHDFYWPINQVRLSMQYGDEPGSIVIWADTDTPGFVRLLKRINGCEWEPTSDNWIWRLVRGENKLQVCAENSIGRRGPESNVRIMW